MSDLIATAFAKARPSFEKIFHSESLELGIVSEPTDNGLRTGAAPVFTKVRTTRGRIGTPIEQLITSGGVGTMTEVVPIMVLDSTSLEGVTAVRRPGAGSVYYEILRDNRGGTARLTTELLTKYSTLRG